MAILQRQVHTANSTVACRQCNRLPNPVVRVERMRQRNQYTISSGGLKASCLNNSSEKEAATTADCDASTTKESEREPTSRPLGASEENDKGVETALKALKWYKNTVSPVLPRACRFLPTCSEYSMQAYTEFGVVKGTVLTAWRLMRCNPLNFNVRYQGKYDPPTWPPPGFRWLAKAD